MYRKHLEEDIKKWDAVISDVKGGGGRVKTWDAKISLVVKILKWKCVVSVMQNGAKWNKVEQSGTSIQCEINRTKVNRKRTKLLIN